MDLYHQFIDPTKVSNSLTCNFIDPQIENLILSKGTLLQIFQVISVNETNDNGNKSLVATKAKRLKLIVEYRLDGLILDLHKIKTVDSPTLDNIIVCFKTAKVSLLRWDHLNFKIDTVSLHFYEPYFQKLMLDSLDDSTIFKVDPNGYCACLVYKDLFCFLPFKQGDEEDDQEENEEDLYAEESNRKKRKTNNGKSDGKSEGEIEDRNEEINNNKTNNSHNELKQLFDPSFILTASKLDPSIKNIINIEFLNSYHEPILAILFQEELTWTGTLPIKKDTTRLLVLSLDLKNASSTVIIDVKNLPYDLDKILPLPDHFNGGCLLVGSNEIIHVNPMGSTSGIGINSFYKDCSKFKNLKDQSSLNLKLENCFVSYLGDMDKFLIINNSDDDDSQSPFYVLKFNLNAGSMSNFLQIEQLPSHANTQDLVLTRPICINKFNEDDHLFFVGCDGGDSMLISWDYKNTEDSANGQIQELENEGNGNGESEDVTNNLEDEDEDAYLYSDDESKPSNKLKTQSIDDKQKNSNGKKSLKKSIQNLVFTKQDHLINCGPITSFTMAKISTEKKFFGLINPNLNEECIIASSCYDKSSKISILQPSLKPIVKSSLKFSNVNRIWTIRKDSKSNKSDYLVTTNFDNYKTEIFSINDNYKNVYTVDFNVNEITILMKNITKNNKILQITTTSIKVYDNKFHILVSLKFDNEIIYGYNLDNFVMITLQNGDVEIFEFIEHDLAKLSKDIKILEEDFNKDKRKKQKKAQIETKKQELKSTARYELLKLELPSILSDIIITTGCIINSTLLNNVKIAGVKKDLNGIEKNNTTLDEKVPLFFLVTVDNRIIIFQKNHDEKIFQLSEIEKLNELINIEQMFSNPDLIPDPKIKQILVCDLGDQYDAEEYLTILTVGGEIIIYKIFNAFSEKKLIKINDLSNLLLTGAPDNAYPNGTKIERKLIYLENLNGFKSIMITGLRTFIIIKTSKSLPKIFRFTKLNSVSIASFNNLSASNGLIYIDDNKNARVVEIDSSKEDYTNNLPIRQLPIGETIKTVTYHVTSNTFIVSIVKKIPYNCVDEDGNKVGGSNDLQPPANSYKGYIKLISPMNWSVIDQIELEDNEVALNIKSAFLDISKNHQNPLKKEFLIIGCGIYRMEDLAANGSFKLFDIISIIPEPGKPETNHKFKEIFQDQTKGAVTTICDISGRFLTAQGQKIIIRDLQDDNTVLPVAFYDCSVYVSESKSFEDLLLLGDSMKSVWLLGFDAEPYRMIMLGKDNCKLDVSCADFIIYDKQLYILVADHDNILHLLQYDPEHPGSQLGQKLLRKAIFKLNSKTTCIKRLLKFEEFNQFNKDNKFQCLGSNADGSFFKIVPISESTYRRFYVLQQQIIDKEFHIAGLNPRLNRFDNLPSNLNGCLNANSSSVINGISSRPILEFDLIKKFLNFNEDRRRMISGKVGKNSYSDIYRDFIEIEHSLDYTS
ncbi:hypothetical protein PACTADRAFT_47865 [Pachysolen tannophilus NRRL Y-2460]|uniref:Cleavage/polyadenylation specificity factor A subunit C-terminal domain-containing protein n=1 Tax=Pachysolen tannophilus NRRL Y-2460 TaxID=669874 RepID=A0A1E4U209_PACTA|nr:hypothetical protein PACTADRAFT_47865 [Pachysolen tannophilus NRRL Y-2460]